MTWRAHACAQLQDYTGPQKRLVEQKELRYKSNLSKVFREVKVDL